jgi:hypothetical protein
LNIPNPFKNKLIQSKEEDLTHQILKNQVSTNTAYMLQEDPTTRNFIIKCKPGETNDNKSFSFNIYLYKDDFRFNLISSWSIRVNFLETIDIHSQLGTKINQRFFVETNERKTIQCFSSNPELVMFNEKYSVPIILIPDIPNEMKFIVFPKKKDNISEVIINVVDIANKEIIKSILIRVIPEYPTFAHVVRIDCNVGTATHFKYEYTSKLNKWSTIKFESNDEDFLRIIDSNLNFNPRETKQVLMVVPEQSQRGIAEEVILFISDTEELFSETILFQFHFK